MRAYPGTLDALLRDYWRADRRHRPGYFPAKDGTKNARLFAGGHPDAPLQGHRTEHLRARRGRRRCLAQKGIHSLRHSYATHLLEAGAEITAVQRLLGHIRPTTTARYLHVTAGRLGQIVSPIVLLAAVPAARGAP